jgi:hypothetical protein
MTGEGRDRGRGMIEETKMRRRPPTQAMGPRMVLLGMGIPASKMMHCAQ